MGSVTDLTAQYTEVIPRANVAAYRAIRTVLLGRGFTAAVIDAWDDNTTWNYTLGINRAEYYANVDPEHRAAINQEWTDLIKDLGSVVIVVSDQALYPTTDHGRIGSGDFDTTDDIHTIDD